MIGKNHQGALVTLVDRVSKFTLIKKVHSKHAEVVDKATNILSATALSGQDPNYSADNGKQLGTRFYVEQIFGFICLPRAVGWIRR